LNSGVAGNSAIAPRRTAFRKVTRLWQFPLFPRAVGESSRFFAAYHEQVADGLDEGWKRFVMPQNLCFLPKQRELSVV